MLSNRSGSYCRSKNTRFSTAEKNGCYLCWKNFPNNEAYESHMKEHWENVKVNGINANWKSLGNVELISLDIKANESSLILNLKNNSEGVIIVRQVGVFSQIIRYDLVQHETLPITLGIDGVVTLRKDLHQLGDHNHITVLYETPSSVNYEAIQSYRVQVIDCEQQKEPKSLEHGMKLLTVRSEKRSETPAVVRPTNQGSLKLGKLSNYMPSVEIKSLHNARFQPNEALTANEVKTLTKITQFKGPLTPSNYIDMMTLMVEIEDYGSQLSVMRSTKMNRSLVKVKGNEYVLKLHEREGRPLFLLPGDQIWIKKSDSNPRIYGFVQRITRSEIQMKFQTSSGIVPQLPIYSIHFEMNRLTFKLQRLALDAVKRLDIIDLLFPQQNRLNLLMDQPAIPKLDIHDKRLKGDTNQNEAVHHIVAGTAYPFPYLLIGFPGTGKTATIVESIYQLWKTKANNKILVCAQSNSVCDEIGQRLIAVLPKKYQQQYDLIRLFAASVRRSCNNDDLLEHSNFDERHIPCLTELYKYRIVIATLTVSGRLLQADMDSNHFTHLFIDECESATEGFTLIPIALCSSMKKINAHIVLSGDPHQLGPVVRDNMAKEMTMDVSMLKRLIDNPMYQKKKKANSFDRRITCRLRNNYRSHPDLVNMPNQLFYNNEMKCCLPINVVEKMKRLSELDFLPKKGFPILFEHVEGIPETMENCSSWFNQVEEESILHYIEKLLQNETQEIRQCDIGIIAAYKRQVIHIMEALEERNYTGIEVGTVEQFQGREKPIIIISTVRNKSLGFLQQRERINVLLTRAIGLLIVIGHTIALRKNSDWKKVIDYTSSKCGGEIVADYNAVVGGYRC